jgi:hypothetical protein
MLFGALAGAVVALGVLGGGSLWRRMARRDHRCTVVSRPAACAECVAVLRGEARGGHVVCACGAVSEHLHGTVLLAWQARHQGEPFPGEPRTPPAPAPATEQERATDAALAAVEAEDEALRRAAHRARRRPDPRTPQVLREAAEQLETPPVVNEG